MGNDGIESSLVGQVAGPSRLASIGTPANPGDSNGLLSGIGQSLGVQAAVPPIWWNPTTWSEDKVNDFLWNYRTIVAAGTASLVSTAASFPVGNHLTALRRRPDV